MDSDDERVLAQHSKRVLWHRFGRYDHHILGELRRPREGIVMVRWPTPTAGLNIRVAQAGCLYAVSRSAFSYTASAGSGTFDVIQQSVPNTCGGPTQDRCVWTAVSDVSWITITSSMPRSGDNPVAFTVATNDGAASRVGRIAVRDKVVVITQAGR